MTTTDPTLLPSTDGLSLMPDTDPAGGRGVNPDETPERAQRAGTRTRTRSIWRSAPRGATPSGKSSPPQFTPRPAGSLWTAQPPSLAAINDYTRRGGWMPGEQWWPLEAAGMVYGWAVALPASLALYLSAWLLQRPSRVAVTGALAAAWVWLG